MTAPTSKTSPSALVTRHYALVTGGYWAFTLTDGALRMLVLLHFHDLGFSPVSIAFLFLAYELMGIVTNLLGGWVGSRTGLNRTLVAGLILQALALTLLTLQQPGWIEWLSVSYVMAVQALSGVAKDLTKMSAKSAVKSVAGAEHGGLFRLVALLTGSKNALKGVGFFLGAALLANVGYRWSLLAMAGVLLVVAAAMVVLLRIDIGKAKKKAPLRSILSKSSAVNRLSAARFFLFGARDIWFVVALPVFLDDELLWSFQGIGGFLAAWVIGYGIVQSVAPKLIPLLGAPADDPSAAIRWVLVLTGLTAAMALGVSVGWSLTAVVIVGLLLFGVIFAINSSLHSYLIVAYAEEDSVSLDVGFYYSANAAGRLVGTLLSGLLYLVGGIEASLWGSAAFLALCLILSTRLPSVADSAAKSGQAS